MKIDFKRIWKKLKKLNFTSVVFLVLSLISSTFAWFAFNNIVNHDMNIDIKAWKVDISEGDSLVTNKIDINLDSFYPGIDDVTKTVTIANDGDIDSVVSYKINYLRILDQEFDVSDQVALFDKLAQEYPFTINFSLDNEFLGTSNETQFTYHVAWPLDSGDNNLDAKWGNDAYDFLVEEARLHNQDNSYQMRDCISIEVELMVQQFVGEDNEKTDDGYKFGTFKYLTTTGETCSMGDSGCYKYYVIERDNTIVDTNVLMIADTSQLFSTVNYNDNFGEYFDSYELFDIVSHDILNTKIIRPELSDRVLGVSTDRQYYDDILEDLLDNGGYIEFSTTEYPMLNSGDCYWLNNSSFDNLAVKYLEGNKTKIYFENSSQCKVVPYMEYTK